MRTEVVPGEAEAQAMNAAAVTALQKAVSKFAEDLYEEAERLDFGSRSIRRKHELTSTHITDANAFLRKGYSRTPRPFRIVCAYASLPVLGLVGGVLGTDLQTNYLGFIAIAVTTSLLTAFLLMKD
jgi:hypothetical protein